MLRCRGVVSGLNNSSFGMLDMERDEGECERLVGVAVLCVVFLENEQDFCSGESSSNETSVSAKLG